jgi:hypothetical protein
LQAISRVAFVPASEREDVAKRLDAQSLVATKLAVQTFGPRSDERADLKCGVSLAVNNLRKH